MEVECGEKVYSDPQNTAEILKKNYGFAGKDFVKAIKEIGIDKIKKIQKDIQKDLYSDSKMQKQSISLSIVLTADKIATDYLFKDGCYISLEEAKNTLIDRNEVSDNERCYEFILDKVAMNNIRFDISTNCEKWGLLEDGYAIMYNQAFTDLCESGGFSKKSFLSWALKNNIVQSDNSGNPTKQKKIDGKNCRCIFLKLNDGMDKDGFINIDPSQEELPFD